jgi:RNA recognition motif-containing protein
VLKLLAIVADLSDSLLSILCSQYFPKRVDMKGGYAFIEFEAENDAIDALKYMDGSIMLERRLAVRPAGQPNAQRRPFGGEGGGAGGGHGGAPLPIAPRPNVAYGFRIEVEVSLRTNAFFLLSVEF